MKKIALNLMGRELFSFEYYSVPTEDLIVSNETVDTEIIEQGFGF